MINTCYVLMLTNIRDQIFSEIGHPIAVFLSENSAKDFMKKNNIKIQNEEDCWRECRVDKRCREYYIREYYIEQVELHHIANEVIIQ